MSEITDRMREFIEGEYRPEGAPPLTDDLPLLGDVLDSLGFLQLLAFIEDEWDIKIPESALTAERFGTLADVERLIVEVTQESS